jgi:hypothetical protein
MAAPTDREITAVQQAFPKGVLGKEEHGKLVTILKLLGFDAEKLNRFFDIDVEEAKDMLVGDDQFSVGELIGFCRELHFRPGIVQGLYNFDGNQSKVEKGEWTGPHPIFVNGHNQAGSAIKKIADRSGTQTDLDATRMRQVGSGNFPVTLDFLRDLVDQASRRGYNQGHLNLLRDILEKKVPRGIKTVSELESQPTKAAAAGHESKGATMETQDQEEVVWQQGDWAVRISGREFVIGPGPDMAAVATRVRELLKRDNLAVTELVANIGRPPTKRSKILSAIEKGNDSFNRAELEKVAECLKVSVTALLTGKGLGFPDPVMSTKLTTSGVSLVDASERTNYFRDRVLKHGRESGLVDGVNPWDIVDLMSEQDNPDIDWVEVWLTKMQEGQDFQAKVNAAVGVVSGLHAVPRELYLELLVTGINSAGDQTDQ